MTSCVPYPAKDAETLRAMAHQLLEILRQETQCLSQKDHQGVLAILPQKEALARRIVEALRSMAHAIHKGQDATGNRDMLSDLRETLRQIDAINEANRRCIAELLEIHEELLSMLVPQTYSQTSQRALPLVKGYGIRTEV